MTRISGVGGGGVPARRAGRAGGAFALGAAPAREAGATSAAAAVPALLSLQEGEREAAPSPGRARRRAEEALDMLRELQLDLLRGRADPARLERLEALAEAAETADPGLRALLAEVALRAKVELARSRFATASAA